jgi:hypothetical protein
VAGWHWKHDSPYISQLLKEIPILVFVLAVFIGERKNLRFNKN